MSPSWLSNMPIRKENIVSENRLDVALKQSIVNH